MSRGNERNGRAGQSGDELLGHVDDWGERVVDYLDGRLDPGAKSAVERHLEACPDCAARVQSQYNLIKFLQGAPLEDVPQDLEQRVLGEMMFPSKHVPQPQIAEQPRTSVFWRRKIRPWIPATVAVAALLAAVVGYGVLRPGDDLSTNGTERAAATTVASVDEIAAAAPGQAESIGVTSTAAAAATIPGDAVTSSPATESTVPATTQDRKAMVSSLEAAEAPAYVAFEVPATAAGEDNQPAEPVTTATGRGSTPTSTTAVPPEKLDAVVSQMAEFTGMKPLEEDLSLGGPTFAAYVPRGDVEQLIDLMRSIGISLGLTVSLAMAPPAGTRETVDRLLQRKAELPVLSASRTPQPAVSGHIFTTSTMVRAGAKTDATLLTLPDEASTHVLVVFYVRY